MEDVADEHKIAFDVFERESEEDGTVDISNLPDLLRRVCKNKFQFKIWPVWHMVHYMIYTETPEFWFILSNIREIANSYLDNVREEEPELWGFSV